MTRKEAFIENICKPLAEMTYQNDHSGAVVYVAKYLNDLMYGTFVPENSEGAYAADLLKWAKYIQEEHNRIKYLHEPLLDFRNKVEHECLRILSMLLPANYITELKKAL